MSRIATRTGGSASRAVVGTIRRHPRAFALPCACVFALAGCVERRISITSEPPGALVWVNDVEVGRTPAETNFKHYGKYDVRLELDGYDTVETVGNAKTPWWDFPGPDLIAEAVPNAKNTVKWHFVLTPTLSTTMPREQFERELIDRAHALRDQMGEPPASAEGDTPDESVTTETSPESSVGVPVQGGDADDSGQAPDAPDNDSARSDR